MTIDVHKQERVVTILYDLLRSQGYNGNKEGSFEGDFNRDGIREALDEIMETFGYDVILIQ